VDDLRLELGKAIASRHLANKRLSELERRHAELRPEIETALDAGREDLARDRVSDELQAEAQIDHCRHAIQEASSLQRELERALAALLRARREFTESRSNEEGDSAEATWGEGPAPGPFTRQPTHERRVQERLLDLKSRRQVVRAAREPNGE
jgi:phage shock protein A